VKSGEVPEKELRLIHFDPAWRALGSSQQCVASLGFFYRYVFYYSLRIFIYSILCTCNSFLATALPGAPVLGLSLIALHGSRVLSLLNRVKPAYPKPAAHGSSFTSSYMIFCVTSMAPLAVAVALLLSVAAGATAQPACRGPVVISEVQASNTRTLQDEDGDFPDWLELRNAGSATENLGGFRLSDKPGSKGWEVPPGVSLAPGTRLVVFASGKSRGSSGRPLHTDFKISSEDGYVALLRSDGSPACELIFPALDEDRSFGEVGGGGGAPVLLESATPGASNSGPDRTEGPNVMGWVVF
jgi:hypothetical protein